MLTKNLDYQLVFVRHAHRDTTEREVDNGISPKGNKQVEELKLKYEKKIIPEATLFLTSPKKRCIETLQPLTMVSKVKLQIEDSLDEQSTGESSSEFFKRVSLFLEKLMVTITEKQMKCVYLCSHGDVIPEMIEILTGKSVDVDKGKAVVLDSEIRWALK
jgi:broad specificity phosphatase PhoE